MNKGELKEDKYFKKARFEDLHSIQIGKYFLYENDFEKYFGNDEESIILLKRVFQKEYKITRTSNGLPRVPSRAEDKEQIIKLLQSYFNILRGKIVRKRAESGDSISLRENIDGIQQIKLLIDHFEESTETFPYHMFKDYLDNREYIKSTGDVNKQMREFQFNKSQNERIRNLLRQFSLLYLKDRKQDQFDVRDPGVFSERFESFMSERDVSKIPPILKDLILLLDGKYSVIAKRDDEIRDELYNPERVYEELDRLLKNIDNEVEAQKGGAKPYLDKEKGIKGLDEQVTAVVDYILEKYKNLQDAHKQVILNKDKEYSMLDEESTKKILDLEGKLVEAEDKLTARIAENSTLVAQISNLEGTIRNLQEDIEKKNSEIQKITLTMKSKFTDNAVVKSLTEQLSEAQEKVANLEREKTRVQNELNDLTPQLAEATRLKEEADATVIRLRRELETSQNDLTENRAELEMLRKRRTELEVDLSDARTLNKEKDDYVDTLKSTIEEKDTLLNQRERFIKRTSKEKKELEAILEALGNDFKTIRERYTILNTEKDRLENELQKASDEDMEESKEKNSKLLTDLKNLRDLLTRQASLNEDKVASLNDRIDELERNVRTLEAAQVEYTSNQTRLASELGGKEAIIAGLRAELESLDDAKKNIEKEAADLRARLASNPNDSQTINDLQAALASKTLENNSLDAEVKRLTPRVAELEETVRGVRAELTSQKSTYEAQIKSLEESKEKLQREYDALLAKQPEISNISSSLRTALSNIEDITKDKTDALAEQERLTDELNKKTVELTLSNSALTAVTAEKNMYEKTAKELKEANDSMKKALDDCEKVQADLKKKEDEISSLEATILQLGESLELQRSEIIKQTKEQLNSQTLLHTKEKSDLIEKLRVAEMKLASKTEQYDEILETNRMLQEKIKELEKEIKQIKENKNKSSFDPTSTSSISQRRFTPPIVEEPNINEWLINIKKLFDEKYSYGVKKNYNFILTVQSYIGDTNDLKYEDLGMMLNYLMNTLGRLPPSDIIFTNGVMSDLELIQNKKVTLYDLVNNLKKLAREYKLLDNKGNVLGSVMFRQSLDSDSLKKFEKIRNLKDRIDYMLDKILNRIGDFNYTQTKSLFEQHLDLRKRKRQSQRGGNSNTLFEYCSKIADDSLKEFLLETPLPFFSLIKDFEKDSKLDIVQSINEEYILKLFITEHLKNYFESKEMKEFYFHAKELFTKDKDSIYNYAKMFFVLQEIINTIRSDDRKIDVLRIKSKEYNSSFDYLNFTLESHEYDFYNIAKKELLNNKHINLTFKDSSIFIALSDKDDHVYDFNKNLTMTVSNYKYKNDIYYMNDSMIYLFFILSTHFYLQSENLVDLDDYKEIEDRLESSVRKLKRFKSKNKRSIEALMKERKDFKEIK
jgi:chromosome segregation ATPase